MSEQTFRGKAIVSKYSYTTYYFWHQWSRQQRALKRPKKHYLLSWTSAPALSYECTKAEFSRFDVPDLSEPDNQRTIDRWADDLRHQL